MISIARQFKQDWIATEQKNFYVSNKVSDNFPNKQAHQKRELSQPILPEKWLTNLELHSDLKVRCSEINFSK